MKIAVIGLGSMGKRRINLIRKEYKDIEIYGIDSNEDRRNQVKEKFDIKVYSQIDEFIHTVILDAVIICTSPNTHADIILKCLNYKLDIFTEINLVSDKYDKILKKAEENKCKLFLSSTPMYRKEMEYITKEVKDSEKRLNYVYHIGQYLPDWHPWESYKDFFVGNKKTNGCREIFAIELPWILNAFGDVSSVSVSKSKNTDLDIDYDDNYIVTINHNTGHKGVMIVDVVSRKAVRLLEVFGEELYIEWKGTPTSLNYYDFVNKKDNNVVLYLNEEKDDNYAQFVIENAYLDEIKDFINYLGEKSTPRHSFIEDIKILDLIDQIEK
jgi:predicted dehydrogenase